MKNPAVFYGVIALGVIIMIAGVYMHFGMHFHGKAYAVIALGLVALLAGIAAMFVLKPRAVAR